MDFGRSVASRCVVLKSLLLVSLLILATAVGFTEASVHVYDRDSFREVGNAYLISGGSEGIAAPADRRGRSYIRFENITFWRSETVTKNHQNSLVQVVIFEAADRDRIGGSAYGGQRSICCTPDLAKLEDCTEGEVIRTPSPSDDDWPVVLNVKFWGNYPSTHVKKNKEINIKKTGMYNLFFITCDLNLKGMWVTGQTVWKNPDGYLPGRMSPFMRFYAFMSIAYAILCIIWFIHTGTRPVELTTLVVTIGAVQRTVSRLLILSVAMGYGVVKPTLGGLTPKVLLVGATYFFATEMLNFAEYVGTVNDIAGRARVFFVLPVALLDSFIILWIFTSLSKTLEQLQAKRSSEKLEIYRKFSNALAVTVIVSVVWIGYELYFKATDPFNEKWASAWIITAFWDVLAFTLLCVICFLWAPSQSSQRYAYSEIEDEETKALCRETPRSSIGLVKQHAKDGDTSDEEEEEEGKRE